MIIERISELTLLPEAVEVLSSTFHIPLYNSDYNKRPPLGIYNFSVGSIWNNFIDVLDELEDVLDKGLFRELSQPDCDQNLLEKLERLLASINGHFDDCVTILRCFFAPTISRKKFEGNSIVDSYTKSVQDYRSHVADIMNHIKHHQGKLRAIFMFTDEYCIPGYFVEGVDETGAIVPFTKLHPWYQGMRTAYSFSRNLKYHLYGVYFISKCLAEAVNMIVGASRTQLSLDHSPPELPIKIAERISKLPNRFFADELHAEVPSVRIYELENGNIKLKLAYPDNNAIVISTSGKATVRRTFVSDGVSLSYGLPYLR